MTSASQYLWDMWSKLSPANLTACKGSYKVKGATPQCLKLALATYHSSLWGFRDDVRTTKRSRNISQLKRLMIIRVKMPRATPKRWRLTGCSHQRRTNTLPCLEGLERVKSRSLQSSIGWRRMSNLNPRSSPELRSARRRQAHRPHKKEIQHSAALAKQMKSKVQFLHAWSVFPL